jgi:alpha-L-fucosidase
MTSLAPVRRPTRVRSSLSAVAALLIGAAALVACSDAPGSPTAGPTLCDELPSSAAATAPLDGTAAERALPAWYDDAKLGIMIHWGVWTIPAWAETTLDPERVADPDDPDYLLAPGGIERFVRHNPYTEWYENSLAIDGTATQAFHRETYGPGFPYTGFQPLFDEASAPFDADVWARLFASARARYVVFVTKHHDGYALWPTGVENPERPGWNASRDFVGEIADATRARCMRLGLYYSGGIDWSFAPPPIATVLDFIDPAPPGPVYARYVEDHYRELIARYRPSVLWNDITSPALTDEAALFADYYAAVPDGVVNDRWGFDGAAPADFRTAEYDVRDEIAPDKWEAVRGIGRTFGFNANQPVPDYGTAEKYLHLLADVVSKNGNLLLNVGPMADGTVPAPQVEILEALGAWLERYGAAIFATRPWTRFGGESAQGIDVRFTQSPDGSLVYAILLGTPDGGAITLRDFAATPAEVRLADARRAGHAPLEWRRDGDDLRVELPSDLDALPAHALAITLE